VNQPAKFLIWYLLITLLVITAFADVAGAYDAIQELQEARIPSS